MMYSLSSSSDLNIRMNLLFFVRISYYQSSNTGFYYRPFPVEFVVYKMALAQVFPLNTFRHSLSVSSHQFRHSLSVSSHRFRHSLSVSSHQSRHSLSVSSHQSRHSLSVSSHQSRHSLSVSSHQFRHSLSVSSHQFSILILHSFILTSSVHNLSNCDHRATGHNFVWSSHRHTVGLQRQRKITTEE